MKYIAALLSVCALFIATPCYPSVLVIYNDSNFYVEAKIDSGNFFTKKVFHRIAPHKRLIAEVQKEALGNVNVFSVFGNNLVICEPLFVFYDYAIVFSNIYNQGLKCHATKIDDNTLAKLKSDGVGK